VTEVDPVGGKSLAQIEVGKEGKLEFPASDGAGHVFVNIEEPGILGVIDVKAQKLTAKWKMAGCEDASGLAYTGDKTKLLIASCGNQVAKVVSAVDGKEVASIPIGKGPDADARLKNKDCVVVTHVGGSLREHQVRSRRGLREPSSTRPRQPRL
jgi:hypothetical protein